jgi:hypothetical protein
MGRPDRLEGTSKGEPNTPVSPQADGRNGAAAVTLTSGEGSRISRANRARARSTTAILVDDPANKARSGEFL